MIASATSWTDYKNGGRWRPSDHSSHEIGAGSDESFFRLLTSLVWSSGHLTRAADDQQEATENCRRMVESGTEERMGTLLYRPISSTTPVLSPGGSTAGNFLRLKWVNFHNITSWEPHPFDGRFFFLCETARYFWGFSFTISSPWNAPTSRKPGGDHPIQRSPHWMHEHTRCCCAVLSWFPTFQSFSPSSLIPSNRNSPSHQLEDRLEPLATLQAHGLEDGENGRPNILSRDEPINVITLYQSTIITLFNMSSFNPLNHSQHEKIDFLW
jgi:hypothetical protein